MYHHRGRLDEIRDSHHHVREVQGTFKDCFALATTFSTPTLFAIPTDFLTSFLMRGPPQGETTSHK